MRSRHSRPIRRLRSRVDRNPSRKMNRLQLEPLEQRLLLTQIAVHTSQVVGTISPDLTGTNALYAFEQDSDWQDGHIAADLKAIGTSLIRYPGGEVTSYWHWNDQVGIPWSDSWDP